jgi:hypothetical protein
MFNIHKGNDVFQQFAQHEFDLFGTTGETIDTFEQLYELVYPELQNTQQRSKTSCLINWKNQLLITLIWLRSYPTYQYLALLFDVSITWVFKIIHLFWPILHRTLFALIRWPSMEEWDSLRDNWPELKGAVGCIDGTSHRINRPTENQGLFYSGHRHMHCIHTQVIIDNCKRIRYIKSSFLGHNNDATTYHLMDPSGPAEEHQFPRNCFLLRDTIYPSQHPLVTPYTNAQLCRQDNNTRRKIVEVNDKIRKRRVYVEHSIRRFKIYKIIGSLYRHKCQHIPRLVELCAALSFRRDMLHND